MKLLTCWRCQRKQLTPSFQYLRIPGEASMSKTAILLLFTLLAIRIQAQSGSSTLSGDIKDPSGAPIPAAKVKISNQDTGVALETSSNESGIYRVGSLVP